MIMTTSVVAVLTMGHTEPEVGIAPTYPSSQSSVPHMVAWDVQSTTLPLFNSQETRQD